MSIFISRSLIISHLHPLALHFALEILTGILLNNGKALGWPSGGHCRRSVEECAASLGLSSGAEVSEGATASCRCSSSVQSCGAVITIIITSTISRLALLVVAGRDQLVKALPSEDATLTVDTDLLRGVRVTSSRLKASHPRQATGLSL